MATLNSFTLFTLFPLEIRLQIWKAALPPPRHIQTTAIILDEEVTKQPLLLACKESSAVFLSHYTQVLHDYYGNRPIHVDFQNDVFYQSVLSNYGYGEFSIPEGHGVRICAINHPLNGMERKLANALPWILSPHPQIEVLHVVIGEVAFTGVTEEQQSDYLRWLKRNYEAAPWGKEENLKHYWDKPRGVNKFRELRLSFDLSQITNGVMHRWKVVESEDVVGELDEDLAAKWDKWNLYPELGREEAQ